MAEETTDRAERRARAWYAQHIGRTGAWDDLPAARQQQFISAAGRKSAGRCNAPECGGDCLECFTLGAVSDG